MQMASLPPLHLVSVSEEKKEKDSATWNLTDQEKAVAKQVDSLWKVSYVLHMYVCQAN